MGGFLRDARTLSATAGLRLPMAIGVLGITVNDSGGIACALTSATAR
jgi:hypothetical protein